MKQHGFLQTSSAVEKQGKVGAAIQSPLENFRIIFMGPDDSKIKEKIFGTSLMEKELWKLVCTRNEYGWRALHFAVLDYFCEKYHLELKVINHEYRLVEKSALYDSLHTYESILYGDWEPPHTPKRWRGKRHHCTEIEM
jgi:hypothetical protein